MVIRRKPLMTCLLKNRPDAFYTRNNEFVSKIVKSDCA